MNYERIPVGNRGTIIKRGKKGTYSAEFHHDGSHRRKSLKTSNKKIAIDRATKLEFELQEGTYQSVQNRTTISEAVEHYLDSLKTETDGRARKTIVRYRGELHRFRDFCHAKRVRQLSRISPTLFDAYRGWLSESLEPATLYHESMVCKQLLKWCKSRKLLGSNPLGDYKLVKPGRPPKPAPTLGEVKQVYRASSPRNQLYIAMLACSGMRSGELRQLRKEDIDLAGNWIRIVSREDTPTKTRTSRKVPIHPTLKPMLERHLRQCNDGWLLTAEPSSKFPDGNHWINTKKLNERFVKRLQSVNLPAGREENGYSIHSLRHFFETHCVNSGVPPRLVDAWLGHRADKSMAAVYYHLNDEESQRFMLQLDFSLSTQSKESRS